MTDEQLQLKKVREKPLVLSICKICGFTILTKVEELFCPYCNIHIIPETCTCAKCIHTRKEVGYATNSSDRHRNGDR